MLRYNQKSGATDYLTVTGTAGSYTFQCPDTATYIAADTDEVWHYTDERIRVALEADLVGYDFTRTIIKYGNVFPYILDTIMILSSNVDTRRMRNNFDLSIWWDNTLSPYGNLKGNRGMEQSVWTPELVPPPVLDDGNTVAWFDFQEDITKNGSNLVSSWGDQSGSSHDLAQADASKQPVWSTDGVLFDGTTDVMSVAFNLEQPEFIYIVVNQKTFTSADYIFDGDVFLSAQYSQRIGTPNYMQAYAGTPLTNNTATVGVFQIHRILFNGNNSSIQINKLTKATGACGNNDMGGITLGANGAKTSSFSNIQVKEIIIRKVADSETDEGIIYKYLAAKYTII